MDVHGMHGRVIVCPCGMGSVGAKAVLMTRGDGVALMSCEVMTAEKVKDEGSLWRKLRPKSGNWTTRKSDKRLKSGRKMRDRSFVFLQFLVVRERGRDAATSDEFRRTRI
jgi:hypothetical protein